MGTTEPDGLPYPSDYNTPADAPAAYQALAEATQVALTNRDTAHAPTVHGHDRVPLADVANDSVALQGRGPGTFADATHGHNPSGVGIRTGQYTFTAVGAQQEQSSGAIAKAANEQVYCQLHHSSNYITWTVANLQDSSFEIKVRNNTASTTHTLIRIQYLLVRTN